MPTVPKAWDNAHHLPISKKQKLVKERLKLWNKNEFGFIEENIINLEKKIMSLDSIANGRALDDDELISRKMAQLDLWTWLKRKETYWAQNLRAKWLKEGDRNTKFFHTLASIRRCKNTITNLFINGTNVVHPAGIRQEAVTYFRNIFKKELNPRPRFENLNFKCLLSSHVSMLIEPFSHEEIDAVVASCEGNKAPGPDGFNFAFAKSAWQVIKHDIYDIVERFWPLLSCPRAAIRLSLL